MGHKIGDIITGTISGVKSYGIFIKFKDTFGFCHISNCSHKFIKNLNDLFPIGNEVVAKIIEIDTEYNRINLSIKDCENIEIKCKPTIQKPKFEKKLEFKKSNQIENQLENNSKPSFDDMLKTYLKNSEERLNCIGKRNQKHQKH